MYVPTHHMFRTNKQTEREKKKTNKKKQKQV